MAIVFSMTAPNELSAQKHVVSVPESGLDVIDTIPNFLAFVSVATTKSGDEQVKLFREDVIAAHPELFSQDVVYLAQEEGPVAEDRWIGNYLKNSVSTFPVIGILDARLRRDLPFMTQNFKRMFPDFRKDGRVYFTVSLNSFDGRRAIILNHPSVLFGLDVIAKRSGPKANLAVTFDHELFHLYHAQVWPAINAGDGQMWQAVWGEGLATYVSWKMNPDATLQEALLDPGLADRAQKVLPTLASDLLAKFHSTDEKVGALYFSGGNPLSPIPDRAGYYVGFMVAARLGQTRSLRELAHLQGEELERGIRESLEWLAKGNVFTPVR